MVDPISDYISPISPLPNIAPFTYKDGATYLSELERFRKYVNDELVTFINNNFAYFNDTFTTEINALIQQVDNVLATQNAENEASLAAVNAAIDEMNAALVSITASIATANTAAIAAAGSATSAASSATAASGSSTSAATSASAASGSATTAATSATSASGSATAASGSATAAATSAATASTAGAAAGATAGTTAATTYVNAQKNINNGIAGLDASGIIGDSQLPVRLKAANGVVNIKSYGAVGDGTTDDTTSIQNAITAAAAAGHDVYIPYGTYKVIAAITVPAGVNIRGASKYSSVIITAHASNTVLTMGNASGLSDLYITASVARTGIFVDVQGNGVFIDNCQFTAYWVAISVGTYNTLLAVGFRISNCLLSTVVTTAFGSAIQLLNFSTAIIYGNIITGPTSGTQPDNAIYVGNGDTCLISDNNITQHGRALYVHTPSPQHCYALTVVNSLFDSAGTIAGGSTVPNVEFNGSGNVYDTKFSNCWFGLGLASGVSLSGVVDGITFNGCEFIGNATAGLTIATTNPINVVVTGSMFGKNTLYGMYVNAGASGFTVTGNTFGNIGARGANGSAMTVVTGASDVYLIVGNKFRGNTSGLTDGGTGANKTVANNLA